VRLLMRRDQVLKICVNHYVTPALVAGFKEKDSKSWTWAAQDYSDGELTGMTFALRLVLANLPILFYKRLHSVLSQHSPFRSYCILILFLIKMFGTTYYELGLLL
jgi:hypothetical protein